MSGAPDRPAGPAAKAIFGAGLAAVAIGRAVSVARDRRETDQTPLTEGDR